MKAKQQLRKPENWSDFENLCKKLWGEIWKCPEIKKNGRNGQKQNGVDIYGIPFGETQYYGIQCKGKDDYSKSALTEQEIDKEINLAIKFKPILKKLYFATTANKDVKLEEFIRHKNIENLENNLFEIHLFCWEDIVDLIEENKNTYDYYVNSINFKTEHEISFTFENDEPNLTIEVPFIKELTHYIERSKTANILDKIPINLFEMMESSQRSLFSFNKSYARFYFKLANKGSEPLKEFKIFLQFEGEFENIDTCTKGHPLISNNNIEYDTFIWEEDKQGKIIPLKNILVQDDIIGFDTICLKPLKEERKIKIFWKLVSLNYKTEGNLFLNIIPTFIIKEKIEFINDSRYVRTEENIVDLIES